MGDKVKEELIILRESHFGIYGVIIEDNSILTVRKSRGPYEGLLCLTGGTPKEKETEDETLRREIKEETGADILEIGRSKTFRLNVEKDSKGRDITFIHIGLWKSITVKNIDITKMGSEDVEKLEWLSLENWTDRKDISPPLREVLISISGT